MADEVWALDHSTTWRQTVLDERAEPVVKAARAVVDSYRSEPDATIATLGTLANWHNEHDRRLKALEAALKSVGQ